MKKLEENPVVKEKTTKTELAASLGISRQALYYKSKKPARDLITKTEIEKVLAGHPAYGHKRIALELGANRKKILRVMKKFGLKPYKRRVKQPRKPDDLQKPPAIYKNLIANLCPIKPSIIWVADFTYIKFQGKFIYLATVMDLFTREILGWDISGSHDRFMTLRALNMASNKAETVPRYHHSDQGSEYEAYDYIKKLEENKIQISMSKKSHPWENGYQESFYSQFKLDLGWPDQFETWGELIEAIHLQINYYNKSRIHTSLKTSPLKFREQYYLKALINNTPRQRQLV